MGNIGYIQLHCVPVRLNQCFPLIIYSLLSSISAYCIFFYFILLQYQ